jgi:hypothetical protein
LVKCPCEAHNPLALEADHDGPAISSLQLWDSWLGSKVWRPEIV